ncbi:hypothetical protein SAZ10_00510 [Mesorhizobium sp. BAC0120]|uniref:hypothetical protein n=1 Tax=Mesorhizobium sp. BAC0120 TaxID=3090670 RepID=UPI00298C7A9C|nr:hypothetical protein [Mesorhizobium sp. BAC0120]MDW6020237.1 hypothetical protein [Mesorhizobium sp. BAC0120]
MSEIERRPLGPIGKPVSISPEDARAYAYDLLRAAWSGQSAYHSDGRIKDFDDRIESLYGIREKLSALAARIPPSPGRDALENEVAGIPDATKALMDALRYSEFDAPYGNDPKVNRQEYGPYINSDLDLPKRASTDINYPFTFRKVAPMSSNDIEYGDREPTAETFRFADSSQAVDATPKAATGLLGQVLKSFRARATPPGGLLEYLADRLATNDGTALPIAGTVVKDLPSRSKFPKY